MTYFVVILVIAALIGGAAIFKHRTDLKKKAKTEEDLILARIAQAISKKK